MEIAAKHVLHDNGPDAGLAIPAACHNPMLQYKAAVVVEGRSNDCLIQQVINCSWPRTLQ